jgi:putative membrane protein
MEFPGKYDNSLPGVAAHPFYVIRCLIQDNRRDRMPVPVWYDFFVVNAFLTNKSYMKKTTLLPALIAAMVFASCNGGTSENGSSDTTVSTTNTTVVDTAATRATPGTANTASTSGMSSTPLGEMDQAFVKKAAMGGMMEVQAGQVAQQKGMNDRVKSFGAMMVRDHSQANQELMNLAKTKGLMLNDSMDKKTMDHMTAMQKMEGKKFDQHYISMMVEDHNKDVAEFEKAANSATDPDLKAWAAKTLPILKTHQDSAKAISKAIK